MRRHRIAVASNLRSKIGEMGFFLGQILEASRIIERKHAAQNYPINTELDRLNYFFSAYLNTIQAIKDACQTSMGVAVTWKQIAPVYGKFIFYCRNATTHDGSQMINAGQGTKNYIVGPLRRIDSKGAVKELNPPREDVAALSCNIAKEVLSGVRKLLADKGADIPAPEEADLTEAVDAALNSDFIPDQFRKMMKNKRDEIHASLRSTKVDQIKPTLDAIAQVEKSLGVTTT